MWLLDSKLHHTFPETNIVWDGYKTHEKGSISIIKAYLLKRHICKQGCIHQAQVGVYFHRLTLTSLLPLNLSCLSSNLVLSKWQTPGVLQPSPLKRISSRDSVQKTFKGRKQCHPSPNISDNSGLPCLEHQRSKLGPNISWYLLFIGNLCLENLPFCLTLVKHCYFGRNPRQTVPCTLFLVV